MTSGKSRVGAPLPDVVASLEAVAHQLTTIYTRAQNSAETRISPSQLHALEIIERHGRINVNGLAAELGAIPSSASRLCDRLQAAGLIARIAGTANRREVLLALTRGGQALLTRISRDRRDLLLEVTRAMTPASREALLTGLREFVDRADEATRDRQHLA
ncbi:MarR family winged helix-turn-helix transcriptional regulator [Actinokineospora soli]|uniref:MarR family winged helix-turn-helix transcriptional regulator n=1 Tax=Actinokineospora soli TaxID=1048753 RepID=A0ABW2TU49_9PSEU